MDASAYQRRIEELQQQLEASQRVNQRAASDLERKYRQAQEENALLRQGMHMQQHHHHNHNHHHHQQQHHHHHHHMPSPHYAGHLPPSPHGGYGGLPPPHMPIQPQQPVNVSVGNRGSHFMQQQQQQLPPPPPLPPPHSPLDARPTFEEVAQLRAELATKQQIIDQYRLRLKAPNVGLENIAQQQQSQQASPSASLERLPVTPLAPSQGPGGKSAPARPNRASGGGRTLLDVLVAQQEANASQGTENSAAATTTSSPRGADIGIQNTVATHDAFCQTDAVNLSGVAPTTSGGKAANSAKPPLQPDPTIPLTTSFVDAASGGVAEAFFTSTTVLDTVGRLPTSRPLRVNLFVTQAGVTSLSNGSFSGLPLPAQLVGTELGSGYTNGAATVPTPKSSWADEPTDMFGGSGGANSLPASRVTVPGASNNNNANASPHLNGSGGGKRNSNPMASSTSSLNGNLSRGGSFENSRTHHHHSNNSSSGAVKGGGGKAGGNKATASV